MNLHNSIHLLQEKEQTLLRASDRWSNLRLLGILFLAVAFYFSITQSPWFFLLVFGLLVLFYFMVQKHETTQLDLDQVRNELAFLGNEIQLNQGKAGVHSTGQEFYEPAHAFAEDLDLFGPFSLYAKINRTCTPLGKKMLALAFLQEKTQAEIKVRQESVKELSINPEWTHSFLAAVFPLLKAERLPGELPQISPKSIHRFILFYTKLLPVLWAVIVASAFYFGGTAYFLLLFLPAVNFLLLSQTKEESTGYFNAVEGVQKALAPLNEATQLIFKSSWESPLLSQTQVPNPEDIRFFGKAAKRMELRKNAFAAFFWRFFGPFDIYQTLKLNAWSIKNPDYFKHIIHGVALFEEQCSLALFSTKGVFPELLDGPTFSLSATDLKHPLIEKDAVGNDFEMTQTNRVSLITGSNMSGKSTFLRTMGCSILLAQAGAAVKAQKMSLNPKVRLFSYMRIKDDLSQNTSTFKEEINRVKRILEAMNKNETYLFLIDEMLRGTNSEDKLKGSLAMLEKLALSRDFALVATHDLRTTELANTYPQVLKNYYFEFFNQGEDLAFDFKIKEGICQSFNASLLLKQAGLS